MKLAKKMLASVMALAIVAALALTAFAAPAVVMTADANLVEVGDEVTITVSGSDIAGLKSGDLVFTYDAETLAYVSGANAYPDFDLKTVNGNEAGVFRFSFAYMETATADNAFCTITFKALKAGTATVSYVVVDAADSNTGSWDGVAAPAATSVTIEIVEEITDVEPVDPVDPVDPEDPEDPEDPVDPEDPAEPTSDETTTKTPSKVPQTGEAGVAAIAGVMALAAVAFVATRKKDEE